MEKFLRELESRLPPSKTLEVADIKINDDPVEYESEPSDISSDFDDESETNENEEGWLLEQCQNMETPELDAQQLYTIIINLISGDSGMEELQSLLVDIVGFDKLEFVAELLSRRSNLKECSTNSSIGLSRRSREVQIRDNQHAAAIRNATLPQHVADPHYPHVYRKHAAGNTISFNGMKYALPVGTERESFENFEEVRIPAPSPDTSYHPKQLVPIADLDDLFQVTFSRYSHLNKVQSLVYPIGYGTNENMLICAPTGAGKTDVALITILNTIRQHSIQEEDGSWTVDRDDFKIVYVAPLKALAAEIVEKMASRLSWLRIRVRELTGDMQLTRAEIAETQIIVTTPEKWDVVTRKSTDDNGLATMVKLLIIDEVHLLHEDRGAVIESLVARTLRQVESQQSMIRIIGLSATLPNFVDVSEFLNVNPQKGLFYFDSSFRPVPLEQIYVGVKGKAGSREAVANTDESAFRHLVEQLRQDRQVMVFVHSRKETVKSARTFMRKAQEEALTELFDSPQKENWQRELSTNKNKDMQELFQFGFGVHHAGMSRSERNLTEKLFSTGAVKVLCCTATLAWGVNLPAACVIIKGTQVYDAKHGGFVDLGISDVIQIFGRAGRPQFEKFGTGILVTSSDRLDHYLGAVTHQYPIESRLQARLADTLNAEIALGTVANIDEGVQWLGYTYLHVRTRHAPQTYGLLPRDIEEDTTLVLHRQKLIRDAARRLAEVQMIIFDEEDGQFVAKDAGRIASDFYLQNESIEVFNENIAAVASDQAVLATVSKSGEFDGIKSRQEEQEELEKVARKAPIAIKSGVDSAEGKTNVLIQSWIQQVAFKDTSLGSDLNYVAQNSARIVRAFFLLALSRRWGGLAQRVLSLDKSINRRLGADRHPLLQFELQTPIMRQLESKRPAIEDMKVMSANEIGDLVHNQGMGSRLARFVSWFPLVTILDADVRPITSNVVVIDLKLAANFVWDFHTHHKAQYFWIWVMEDSERAEILHTERLIISKSTCGNTHSFQFAVPVPKHTEQLVVKVESDQWIGAESWAPLSFRHLVEPQTQPIRTDLLRLRPLPVSALNNPKLESYYAKRFSFFNPMQTMVFHSMYNEKTSVLLGSPTGSGKTIAAELAVWGAFRDNPKAKVVYIAPMKALVRERVQDWKHGICKARGLQLVELTGDTNPGRAALERANIIVTTPEKFDGVSRSWHTRRFVQQVALVIMDEVHLLASDRGAILEMIVSRMNYMRQVTNHQIRLLGMSTAVANAGDLAGWLGVEDNTGLFNFPPSVRPVPLEMYIDGFPDNLGFSPFMKQMNRPAFLAIKRHSPSKPVLIFVPSRRQTRLTAQDLIYFCGNEENPRRFLLMDDRELSEALEKVHDETLKLCLQFGIAIHHAGLVDEDRSIAHKLFSEGKVQVLVATSTLAWGVNLPAYLVIVKGTQFFDGKIEKYRDMDLTDVLQMMGRAGRPSFDTSGVSVVFTKQSTKQFYKYFLNIGFPVESSLHKFLDDHIGAEIASGTVKMRQDAMDFLQRTFLFRRVHANPTYYGVEPGKINDWLVERVDDCLSELEQSHCLVRTPGSGGHISLGPSPFLRITSFYYISHKTMRMFLQRIKPQMSESQILQCLALAHEYDELSIRHNEDIFNSELSKNLMYPGETLGLPMVDPHVKAFLLLQARMVRVGLPVEDYIQDTVAVLDQAIRILQAIIDTSAQKGYLETVVMCIRILRAVKQGCRVDDNMICLLPGLHNRQVHATLRDVRVEDMKELKIPSRHQKAFSQVVRNLPRVSLSHDVGAQIVPKNRPVYCPYFAKPQVESWFVIYIVEGKIKSLQRAQKERTIAKPSTGTVMIMNDTLDIDYSISSS